MNIVSWIADTKVEININAKCCVSGEGEGKI